MVASIVVVVEVTTSVMSSFEANSVVIFLVAFLVVNIHLLK